MGGNVKESFNCQYTIYLFKKDIYIYIYIDIIKENLNFIYLFFRMSGTSHH